MASLILTYISYIHFCSHSTHKTEKLQISSKNLCITKSWTFERPMHQKLHSNFQVHQLDRLRWRFPTRKSIWKNLLRGTELGKRASFLKSSKNRPNKFFFIRRRENFSMHIFLLCLRLWRSFDFACLSHEEKKKPMQEHEKGAFSMPGHVAYERPSRFRVILSKNRRSPCYNSCWSSFCSNCGFRFCLI